MKARGKQRFLVVELTESCNNSCLHCYNVWRGSAGGPERSRGRILSAREVLSALRRVMEDISLKYVALSGGEPTLRPDLPRIVEGVKDLGLEPVVLTNGVLLTEAFQRSLPRGTHFQVSLLGDTAELHDHLAGRRVFDRIVRNAARLERHGHDFTAAFVATRANAQRVHRVAELAIALGSAGFMYNRVNVGKALRGAANTLVPTAGQLGRSLGLLQKTVKRYGIQAVCSVPILPCVVDPALFPDIHFGWCPRGGENAYYTIGCDGGVRPCNHSSLVLGDIRTTPFRDILANRENRAYWRRTPRECRDCTHPLKRSCRGGCTAASAEYYGSQERIDPYRELAGMVRRC